MATAELPTGMKKCPSCKVIKAIDDFPVLIPGKNCQSCADDAKKKKEAK